MTRREQIACFHATSERRVSKVAKFTENVPSAAQAFSALVARCEDLGRMARYETATLLSFDRLRSQRELLWVELAGETKLLDRFDAVVAEFERPHSEWASW